jgi:hypothetical protein
VTAAYGQSSSSISLRESGFGVLPRALCIPYTANVLVADGTIDLINEYRGAETLVLRSRLSTNAPDAVAYLMVSRNSTNQHLFVGVPSLPQAGWRRTGCKGGGSMGSARRLFRTPPG